MVNQVGGNDKIRRFYLGVHFLSLTVANEQTA